jgi:tRNA-dihydrouridine synthase B
MDVLDGYDFDLIDFNAACPTTKITRNGKGAALLREPDKLRDILKLLVRRSKVPVTVKIRAGWDSDSINAREVALYAEDAGVSALFIHGRTKTQGYSGTVDYPVIKEVKEALNIPVIASGDGVSLSFIGKMFNDTGCDGVAIARGALGNPWIFRDVVRFFQNGTSYEKPDINEREKPDINEREKPDINEREKPDINERIEIMKRHLNMLTRYYGEKKSVSCFHKFFIWYTRGLSGMKPLRDKAFRTGMRDELISAIEELRGFAGDSNEEQ